MKNRDDIVTAFTGYVCNFVPCCTSDDYHLELLKKVLALLKEQDAVEPYIAGSGESFETAETWWYECGNCNNPIDPNDKFCRHCGRQVKWE